MKILVILTALICLSGCYPTYKTLQPNTTFIVVDEDKRPVSKAEVLLASSSFPHGYENSRVSKFTDDRGQTAFDSAHEFRIESLMMHGSEDFFWNWCVRKDGYETNESHYTWGDTFPSENIIVLKKGKPQSCDDHYH